MPHVSEADADATITCWLVTIGGDRDGYRSVFGGPPHLQIHSGGLPLPSLLPPETMDALRSQGVPEHAIQNGALDFEQLVRAGWNVSSALPGSSE